MRVTNFLSTVLLLLAELRSISAKPVIYTPVTVRRKLPLEDELRNVAVDFVEGNSRSFTRRQESTGIDSTLLSTSKATTSLPTSDMNATISSACISALSSFTQISNEAGMLACYNILQYDANQGTFQADLRVYQPGLQVGSFANIPMGDMMINLEYPPSTSFRTIMKRSLSSSTQSVQTSRSLDIRQDVSGGGGQDMKEIQRYSLFGNFQKSVDLSKINNTVAIPLLIPTISIKAVNKTADTTTTATAKTSRAVNSILTTNLTATDVVYFVVGTFQNQFDPSQIQPATQAAAIAASSAFILPGTTFGIFPTGLIVTGAWMVLFVIAYGIGTWGRLRHRDLYRRRKQATMGVKTEKKDPGWRT